MRIFGWTLLAAALLSGQALSPAWIAVGGDGQAIARIVVEEAQACPAIRIDGATRQMTLDCVQLASSPSRAVRRQPP